MPTASSSNLQRSSSSKSDEILLDFGTRFEGRNRRSKPSFDMIKLDRCVTLRTDWETLGELEI